MAALSQHEPANVARGVGPVDRSDGWRWVVLALGGFVAGALAQLVLLTVGAAIAGTRGGVSALASAPVPPAWFVVVSFVGLWLGFAGACALASRTGRLGVLLHRHDILYVFVGVGLQLGLDVVYTAAGVNSKGLTRSANHLLGGGPGWLLVVPGAMAVLFAPVFEELFFRGVLLRGLLRVLETPMAAVGIAASVATDALLFGL